MGVKQFIPLILFKLPTTKSLLFLNSLDLVFINFWVPFKASTAAAWLTDEGFDVDWDWTLRIAFIISFGPPAGGPKEIIKAIRKVQSQSTSNPSSVSQAAAVEALNGTQKFIKTRSKEFKKRRDFVVGSLNKIKGINCLTPNGAFYVFPSCKKLLGKKTKLKTDKDFVQKLLEKSEVAVVQGSAFGLDGYFRISYATSMENLKKAMERIKTFCESLS